jgi:hypothetical protein
MIDRQTILQKLRPFKNRQDVLIVDQDVSDIITGLVNNHKLHKSEYDNIYQYFVGVNNYETGKNIWNFLKKNVRYKVEPESKQMLKSPAAIITGTINGRLNTSDCKNLSLFTGGILSAINRHGGRIDWCYRFSSYKLWDKVPQHVFCVINPDTNKEIWIDAVLPEYNQKKAYYYKTDKKADNMALVALSGIISGKKKEKKAKKTPQSAAAKKAANKEKRKKFFQKLKAKAGKTGRIIVKYNPATVASRNAFLLLVKINARSLATNLKKLKDKGNTKVDSLWTKIGGNVSTLNVAIDSGSKKKRLGVIVGVGIVNTYQQHGRDGSVRNVSYANKKPKFTTPKPIMTTPAGSRVRSMVVMRTIQNTRGGTEAALTAIVPTVVANAIAPTNYGGGSYGSGGGGGYASPNEEPNELPIANEEIDESIIESIDDDGNIIGVEPTATATAIAAAMPIIISVLKILKDNGISNPLDEKNIIEDVEKANDAAGKEAYEDIEKEAEGIETPTGNKILKGAADKADTNVKSGFPLMPVLLIGGGILAFSLLKKSK